MKKLEWPDVGFSLLAVAALAALIIAALVICSPKAVDGYYLSHGSNNIHTASCVYAHWTWHVDELAFCSDDYQKVLDFAAKANQLVKR